MTSRPPRSIALPARRAVLLPGTGSDEVFVRTVFAGPLRALGIELLTPRPRPGPALVSELMEALDAAAEDGPVVVGGVSLGAHLAAGWAVRNPRRCAGLLLALPAWSGPPGTAPAAAAALGSAESVGQLGLDETLRMAGTGAPDWLAAELNRSWRGYGAAGLVQALRAGAGEPAPSLAELATVSCPAGVAAAHDDPLHPLEVAKAWTGALPHSALVISSLEALGADRESLGRAAVLALLRAHTGSLPPVPEHSR